MGNYGEHFLLSLMLLIVGVSLCGWLQAILRRSAGAAVLPLQPRPLVPWGLLDLTLIVAVVILLQTASQLVIRRLCGVQLQTQIQEMLPWQQATVMVTASTASLIVLVVSLLFVYFRSGAQASDLGIVPAKMASDLTLGTVAFAMLALPVFGLQALLTRWQPTTHPLIEMLRTQPEPGYLWVGIFSAVMVAPIVEEYVFRVFLQGWLENAVSLARRPQPHTAPAREIVTRFLIGGKPSLPLPADTADVCCGSGGLAQQTRPISMAADERGQTPSQKGADPSFQLDPASADTGQAEQPSGAATVAGKPASPLLAAFRPSWWPIFISAGLFALMHLGHGPDPIPLFVLALGLGYLYQRTHRVFPCIVVHLLVNGFTMLQLWLYLHKPV